CARGPGEVKPRLRRGLCRGDCLSAAHRPTLPDQHVLERGEEREHVLPPARLPHQPDAPDPALHGTEPGTDLDAVLREQATANPRLVDAVGHPDRVQHRQAMALLPPHPHPPPPPPAPHPPALPPPP